MSEQAAIILRSAQQMIVNHGWCQKRFCDDQGRMCVAGALIRGRVGATDYVYMMSRGFFAKATYTFYDITRWNDAPGRTKEEVLKAFDRAIALAEQNEQSPPRYSIRNIQ